VPELQRVDDYRDHAGGVMTSTSTPKQDAATIVTRFIETCDLAVFSKDLIRYGHIYGVTKLSQTFKEAVEDELRKHYIAKCRCRKP